MTIISIPNNESYDHNNIGFIGSFCFLLGRDLLMKTNALTNLRCLHVNSLCTRFINKLIFMAKKFFRILTLTLLLLPFCVQSQDLSKYTVVDQFGYRSDSKKTAVLRDPQTGFDGAESFTPGGTYAVVNKNSGDHVLTGSPVVWNSGASDISSGDKAWWFDFSALTTPGTYYILDVTNNVRSFDFDIRDDVYTDVLKQAVRTFFYQRMGFEKNASFAGIGWADGASHIKNLQDKNARQYNKANDPTSELDVSGGWYDAGDYNKYTNWTANYVVDFMRAYRENPGAWGDDYNIPESGNKIPDILDEAKWGIDHLLRMQRSDGGMLSIVGVAHASPPSNSAGPSLYGTASTSATLNSAGAFALASKVFGERGLTEYSLKLKSSAIKAWDWADANPSVLFRNNDSASGTGGLGAGQQETDDYGRFVAKMEAAVFLFDITGDTKYRQYFDSNYTDVHLYAWTYATPFETSNQETLLHYTTLAEATPSVVNNIKAKYASAMNGEEVFGSIDANKDPYRAYLKDQDYTWGSNSTKASKGIIYVDMVHYNINTAKDDDAMNAAEDFVHYLHGVNPLNMVYLSNMYAYGADNGVNEFYHTWFSNGSAKWDRVGVSTYGPAPGFLTGGPNPGYDVDGCCATNSCGGSNALCNSENLTPPKGQPVQKAYKDFNTSWPLNSWSVTENSNGYQLNYIRLLSRFVPVIYDCSGTANGTATPDICGICSGGTTGVTPNTDESECGVVTSTAFEEQPEVEISPNPTEGLITIRNPRPGEYQVKVRNAVGMELITQGYEGNATLNISNQPAGVYMIIIQQQQNTLTRKIIKL